MGVAESHLLALCGDTLTTDDAEWMPGESRNRLAPDLDNGFLMDAGGVPHRGQLRTDAIDIPDDLSQLLPDAGLKGFPRCATPLVTIRTAGIRSLGRYAGWAGIMDSP